MCDISLLLLICIIVCLHCKINANPSVMALHTTSMPKDSFYDLSGKKIQGAGLTPLTTPTRRPCQQLIMGNCQETSSI
jgi:hypothetical protein